MVDARSRSSSPYKNGRVSRAGLAEESQHGDCSYVRFASTWCAGGRVGGRAGPRSRRADEDATAQLVEPGRGTGLVGPRPLHRSRAQELGLGAGGDGGFGLHIFGPGGGGVGVDDGCGSFGFLQTRGPWSAAGRFNYAAEESVKRGARTAAPRLLRSARTWDNWRLSIAGLN